MQLSATVPLTIRQALERLMDCSCGKFGHDPAVPAAGNTPDGSPEALASGLPQRWEEMYFSNAAEDFLQRYYSQQFYWLTQAINLLNNESSAPCTASSMMGTLLKLARLLLTGYPQLLDPKLNFPALLLTDWQPPWAADTAVITGALQHQGTDHPLNRLLREYFEAMKGRHSSHQFSVREFRYADQLISALADTVTSATPLEAVEQRITSVLMRFNFNHLGFLSYLRQQHQEKLNALTPKLQQDYLGRAEESLLEYPLRAMEAYDDRWPSVREHLQGWMQQMASRLRHREQTAVSARPKLQLNLSVAHLSCLLRAFYEAGLLKGGSLAGIFRLLSASVSAKKQADISSTSLKKEYYSVSQFTAARVMELLEQMIAQLNRHYFPVLAAASVMLAAARGNL